MMNKGIGFDIYYNIGTMARNLNVLYISPRCVGLALHRTERSEIILAEQCLCRTMHTIGI
ncbi:hypothetical protein D3C73_1624690 [compost metagenome]